MSPNSLLRGLKHMFFTPIEHWNQYLLILLLAVIVAISLPVHEVNDWTLNSAGLWDDVLHGYDNENRVYPPWAILLLLPFYWMRVEGVRFFSTLVIAWLVKNRQWPFYQFFFLFFSPYFLFTLLLSNMDILVLVFPVLLWETAEEKSWQGLGRGISLSILLLKPQAAVLIWLYFLWQNRRDWRSLLLPLGIVGGITIPVSLIGSPPLLLQWVDNITHPSPQNQAYWADNNISLVNHLSPLWGIVVLGLVVSGLILLYRYKHFSWQKNEIVAGLLMLSMQISPYTSRQSVVAGLVFVPSLPSFLLQYCMLPLMRLVPIHQRSRESLIILVIFVFSILFFRPKQMMAEEERMLA